MNFGQSCRKYTLFRRVFNVLSGGYLTYYNEDLSKDEKIKLEEESNGLKEKVIYEVENEEKFNEIFSSYKD